MTSETEPASVGDQPMFAVVDIEGNGQSPPDIVEIAIVHVSFPEIARPLQWLIRPPKPITGLVTRKVHGITNAAVAAAPSWLDVADEIRSGLAGRILVAHNASVEVSVLRRYLPDYLPPLVVDTLALSRKLWPHLPRHNLDSLIDAMEISVDGTSGGRHRAAYDCRATAELLIHLVKAAGSAEELVAMSAGTRGGTEGHQEALW